MIIFIQSLEKLSFIHIIKNILKYYFLSWSKSHDTIFYFGVNLFFVFYSRIIIICPIAIKCPSIVMYSISILVYDPVINYLVCIDIVIIVIKTHFISQVFLYLFLLLIILIKQFIHSLNLSFLLLCGRLITFHFFSFFDLIQFVYILIYLLKYWTFKLILCIKTKE